MARMVRMPLMRVGEQHPGDIERIETNCATGPRAGRGIVWGFRHERVHPHAKRVHEDDKGRDKPSNLVMTLIHQAGRYMRRLQEMLTQFFGAETTHLRAESQPGSAVVGVCVEPLHQQPRLR